MSTLARALLLLLAAVGPAAADVYGNPGQRPIREGTVAGGLVLGAAPLIRIEAGAEASRTHVSASWIQHPQGAVVLRSGDATAAGATFRALVGPSRMYVGMELGYAAITSAPAFQSGYVFRTAEPQSAPATVGSSLTIAWPFGVQTTAGPFMIGAEAVFGWRRMSLSTPMIDENVSGFIPLVEGRARAGVYLTPTVSLSAAVGTGLLVNDGQSVSLVLGVSRFPWDGGP